MDALHNDGRINDHSTIKYRLLFRSLSVRRLGWEVLNRRSAHGTAFELLRREVVSCLTRRLCRGVATLLVVAGGQTMPCLAANFYVASNGSDANPGTIDRPFATVTKARDAARAVGTNATRNIIIRSGNYYNVAVKLQRQTGADDSGLTIQSFPGEMAKDFDAAAIRRTVASSPFADRIVDILRETHDLLYEAPKQRLSQGGS